MHRSLHISASTLDSILCHCRCSWVQGMLFILDAFLPLFKCITPFISAYVQQCFFTILRLWSFANFWVFHSFPCKKFNNNMRCSTHGWTTALLISVTYTELHSSTIGSRSYTFRSSGICSSLIIWACSLNYNLNFNMPHMIWNFALISIIIHKTLFIIHKRNSGYQK